MPASLKAVAAAAVQKRAITAASVFCKGPLLDVVQRARLFGDAKHFVDMPLRREPEEVLAAFEDLSPRGRADPRRLRAFVDAFFEPPGAELEPHVPQDMPPEPPFVAAGGVRDPGLREFALALHRLWPTLCRVTAPAVAAAPHRYTALPRRHAVVLPGGRFRETYYWDSLWIVQGLHASGLRSLARGLVQNLLDDVDQFGFVPNGGRIYYLNRSQPPVLAAMVAAVAREMEPGEEAEWLPQAVALLRREYDWWMRGDRAVSVGGAKLNRFFADLDGPRPESYWQDLETSHGCGRVCREVASAAETGWDFSWRWSMGLGRKDDEPFHLRDMATTSVLPTCLNAIMYHAEVTLASLCEAVATKRPLRDVEAAGAAGASLADPGAQRFAAAAKARRAAMDDLFWRPSLGRWVDVWLPTAAAVTGSCAREDVRPLAELAGRRPPTLADFAPALWAGLATPQQAADAMQALDKSGLIMEGGVATTLVESGEQWDGSNAWAPLQSMLIEGLRASGAAGGERMAADLAERWVGTCYAAWRETGAMHEKYNAAAFGKGGAGGEYEPQTGFGWSNGVVLDLLLAYGQKLEAPAPWSAGEGLPALRGCAAVVPTDSESLDMLLPGAVLSGAELHGAARQCAGHAN